MKNFTISICILTFLLLFLSAFYIFKLPPFNKSANFKTSIIENPANSNIPLPSKVSRKFNYDERIQKAEMLKKNRYYTLAINEYTLAHQRDPQKVAPLLAIANIYLETKAYKKAIDNLQEIIKDFPDNLEVKLSLIQALIGHAQFKEAKDIASKDNFNEPALIFYQAILESYFKNHAKAKELFEQIAKNNPNSEFKSKADSFLQNYLLIANAKDTKEEYLLTLLAKNFAENELSILTLKLMEEVTAKLPDYRDAWLLMGHAQLKLQLYGEAIASLDKALTLDPERSDIHYFLGLGFFGIDKTKEAITHLEIALELGYEPKAKIYQKLAEMYLMEKNYRLALENYEFALETKDDDIAYYIRPIWILIDHLRSPQKCINLANKAITKHPTEAMSYNLLGWCYLENGDDRAAKINLDRAISIDPNLGAAYLNLGKLYYKINDLDQALNNFKKAYDLNPGDSVGNLAAKLYNDLLSLKANNTFETP